MTEPDRTEPDRIEEFSLQGVPCEIRITGAQKKEYKIEIVPVPPTPDSETASLMAKVAGIDKHNSWTVPGPDSDTFRFNTFETMEHNWQRETLPSAKEPDALAQVVKLTAAHQVKWAIEQLEKENFPADAIPFFRQFAEEDFAFYIGLTIGDYWEWKKAGN